mgnify:CR=1 FL=1
MIQSLSFAQRGDVAELTLDRPNVHNAFDDVLIAELTATLQRLDGDPSIRAVVLTGRGNTFSAGADLHWMRGMIGASTEANRADSLRLATLLRTLNFLSKPTLARVNGSAYGGGVGLLACCDIAIGVEGTKFALTEVKLGIVPAVVSPYVMEKIGPGHMRRYALTAERFDADEARRIGLVDDVVDADDLDSHAEKLIAMLLQNGPAAMTAIKQLIFSLQGRPFDQSVVRETAEGIARIRASDEGKEGISAFLEKRRPAWDREPNDV